jgi:nitroimidazol reductase NimA-like FMN-containing flavoprotein (pyridoxamine 5'-phosphate oxidase superfamily)
MLPDAIEHWEQTQAEIEIRRWLYSIGQWAPGADVAPLADAATAHALTASQIDEVLRSEAVGRIGCHADGRTYVVPVLYAYDGTSVYGHTNDGMKLRMLRSNPSVCFEVDRVERLTDWRSVVAWGRFEELDGAEADFAEQLLIDRLRPLLPGAIAQPTRPGQAGGRPAGTVERRAVVYRIVLSERTGRAARG